MNPGLFSRGLPEGYVRNMSGFTGSLAPKHQKANNPKPQVIHGLVTSMPFPVLSTLNPEPQIPYKPQGVIFRDPVRRGSSTSWELVKRILSRIAGLLGF